MSVETLLFAIYFCDCLGIRHIEIVPQWIIVSYTPCFEAFIHKRVTSRVLLQFG